LRCARKKSCSVTYQHTKLSQDHLELFFGIIRLHGGSNNNPTAKQFISAYRKNLIHLQLKAHDKGNCIPHQEISILHCKVLSSEQRINFSTPGYHVEEDKLINIESETDHTYLESLQELTMVSKHIIRYVGGFVVKYLIKTIKCDECVSALIDYSNRSICLLTATKDRSGLMYPSTDVINVCEISEKTIKQALSESGGSFLKKKFTGEYLTSSVLHYYLDKDIFDVLRIHSKNQSPVDNHVILLIKAIAKKYIDIRLHYIAKTVIDKSLSKRQLFNKLVLFSGV
jgi:hypothetical protein